MVSLSTMRFMLRSHAFAACALLGFLPFSVVSQAQQHPALAPHPAAPRPAAPAAARPAPSRPQNPSPETQNPRNAEHLSDWMNRHRDLPVPQQQRALESEPGFRELPSQTQQRMRDRLTQLNNMRPARRDRILEQNEAIEHLSTPQRQQVRGAMLQLGSLPEDRRRAVARAFRDLRSMPEPERQQYLNSPAFRGQYNDQERGTLNNLMAIEPYLPGRHPNEPAAP